MGRIRGFAARHRVAVSTGAFLGIGAVVFVLVWFQPQKLFIEKTVDEAAPSQTASSPGGSTSASPSVVTVASGRWRSLEHKTTGSIRLLRLANGAQVLRFVDLDTSNGPDLRVYLSRIPPDKGLHDYGTDYIELGRLKGNRGNQNYAIPPGTDVSTYHSAVIWCVRFKVGFAVAPVAAAAA